MDREIRPKPRLYWDSRMRRWLPKESIGWYFQQRINPRDAVRFIERFNELNRKDDHA